MNVLLSHEDDQGLKLARALELLPSSKSQRLCDFHSTPFVRLCARVLIRLKVVPHHHHLLTSQAGQKRLLCILKRFSLHDGAEAEEGEPGAQPGALCKR